MRKILSLLLVSSMSFSMHKKGDLIPSSNVFASHDTGKVQLYHHPNHGFGVQRKDTFTPVQAAYMTKELRAISKDNLSKLIAAGSKFHVIKQSNDSYKIDVRHKLNGGGAFGAWLGSTLGYGTVMFGGNALVWVLTGWCPPLYATATAMTFIPIKTAATAAGIACGVAGGVATGPI